MVSLKRAGTAWVLCSLRVITILARQEDGEDTISVGAGTLDDLPCDATAVVKHIFMADKGAYYDVTDGIPQSDGW